MHENDNRIEDDVEERNPMTKKSILFALLIYVGLLLFAVAFWYGVYRLIVFAIDNWFPKFIEWIMK